MYGAEEAIHIATLLELLPEYLVVDRGARAFVVHHALVVREPLFVDDFFMFVDRVLLADVDQGNQGVKDVKNCVPWDD